MSGASESVTTSAFETCLDRPGLVARGAVGLAERDAVAAWRLLERRDQLPVRLARRRVGDERSRVSARFAGAASAVDATVATSATVAIRAPASRRFRIRVSPLSTDEVEISDADATHKHSFSASEKLATGRRRASCRRRRSSRAMRRRRPPGGRARRERRARRPPRGRRAARARRRSPARGTWYIEWPWIVSALPTTGRLGSVGIGPAERPTQTIRARGTAASAAAVSGSLQSGSNT